MNVIKSKLGARTYTDFKPIRSMQVKPVIMNEVKDEDGIVTHYLCEGNRLFIKDAYDRNFKTQITKIRPRNYKGDSLDGRVIK